MKETKEWKDSCRPENLKDEDFEEIEKYKEMLRVMDETDKYGRPFILMRYCKVFPDKLDIPTLKKYIIMTMTKAVEK